GSSVPTICWYSVAQAATGVGRSSASHVQPERAWAVAAPSETTRAHPARGERRDGERGERGRRRVVIAREAIRPADARTAARVGSGPHAQTHERGRHREVPAPSSGRAGA